MYFILPQRNLQSNTHVNNLYDIDGNIKLQTSTSKSLPNTPKNEEVQINQTKTRACSAVVNANRKDDFRGLDAYLERKQMEKHGSYLTSENYNNTRTCNEESNLEYPTHVQNTDTQLHLLEDNYSNRLEFIVRDEEQSESLSSQYQEIFKFSISFENNFVEDPSRTSNNTTG